MSKNSYCVNFASLTFKLRQIQTFKLDDRLIDLKLSSPLIGFLI